jgi:hypothetical protein
MVMLLECVINRRYKRQNLVRTSAHNGGWFHLNLLFSQEVLQLESPFIVSMPQ